MKNLQFENKNLKVENKKLEDLVTDYQHNYNLIKKNYLITLNKKILQEEQFEVFILKVKQVSFYA